jgi:hypothetical protein
MQEKFDPAAGLQAKMLAGKLGDRDAASGRDD